MKNYILFLMLVIGFAFAKAQNITAAEYFIDTDPGVGQGTALTINNVGTDITDSFTVNVGAQLIGFHRMYVRVQDANAVWSLYHNFLFYVADATPLSNPALPNITAMEYFIDTDPGVGMGTQVAINNIGTDITDSFTANIGAQSIGFHRMYTRVQDGNGVWSLYDQFLFYVSDPTPVNNPPLPAITAAEYFLGTDPGFGNGTAVTLTPTGMGDQFMIDVDFSSITSCTTTPFHLRVQDANGLWSLYDFDPALLVDFNAPVADVAALADVQGTCEVTSLTAPTATDACTGIQVTGTTNATLPINANTAITWTYDDGNGNTVTQTQNVVIVDNTAPVPDSNTLADVMGECELTMLTAPTATDNCASTVTVSNDAVFPITSNTMVTWSYDDGNGNMSTQTQNIMVADTQPPVPNGTVVNGFLPEVMDQCSIMPTIPTAVDACTGLTVNAFQQTQWQFPLTQSRTILWGFNDGNGNIIGIFQNFVINDTTAPVPTVANLPDYVSQCAAPFVPFPTATDNCNGFLTTNDGTFPITASRVLTWTFDDTRGNITTQTQNIIIADTTDPVAIGQDTIIDLAGNSSISIIPSDVDNGSNDNCSAVNLAVSPDTFTAAGIYTVTLTATDATGNTGSTTAQVTVDNTLSNEDFTLSKQILIYPNPTSSMVYIKTTVDVVQLDVYDLHGKLLLEKRNSLDSLSVESLSDGVYLMKIITSTGEFTIKRIIKN